MKDAELEQLIRDVESKHPRHAMPELDEPLDAEIAMAIVQRFSDEPVQHEVQMPRPANRRWIGPLAVLLAAAVVLAILMVPSGNEPLPSYSLTGRTGVSDVRSTEAGTLVAAPGSPVTLVLRPSTRTELVPHVHATAAGSPLTLVVSPKPGGALEVTLPVFPPGRQRVEIEIREGETVHQDFWVDVESRP